MSDRQRGVVAMSALGAVVVIMVLAATVGIPASHDPPGTSTFAAPARPSGPPLRPLEPTRPLDAGGAFPNGSGSAGPSQVASPAPWPTPSSVPSPTGSPAAPASTSSPVNVYAAISGPLDARLAGIPARVYVPDEASGTVVVIDPATFKVMARYFVGRLPHHVTPSWDLATLYVSDMESNRLTEINPRTGRAVGSRTIAAPYNLYFTPDGSKAIVVAEPLNRLDFYDRRTWRLLRRVAIPHAGPNHLDFSADGRYLLVSTEFSGFLVKVDTVRMRISRSLHVGGQPVDVKLSPDGSVFYNANMARGGVSVIDPRTMREIGFIHTGRAAHGLAVSRDTTKLYVTNRMSGTISVIAFATRRVVRTWRIGLSPDMITLSPNGRQLWTSDRFDGRVTVVDTNTGRVIKIIRVDAAPHGLTYFPQPGRFSVGHNGVYR